MIQHKIMIKKLEKIGVKGTTLNFFKSYFKDGTIVVENGKSTSDPQPFDRGEPTRSLLSGLLFITYINDVSKTQKSKSSLYADDIALKSSAKDMKTLQETTTGHEQTSRMVQK